MKIQGQVLFEAPQSWCVSARTESCLSWSPCRANLSRPWVPLEHLFPKSRPMHFQFATGT